MSQFEEIEKNYLSEEVKKGLTYSDLIGKDFFLGQSEWVCRYGTLSDGHEHLTPSQRYSQAIKEAYGISKNIKGNRIAAMKAEADRLDALNKIHETPEDAPISTKLRNQAALEEAETKLASALESIKDQMRMLKAYDAVRRELEPEVKAKYPGGAEQAEPDNWKAVAEYRIKLKKLGYQSMPHYTPLDPFTKAELGVQANVGELSSWLEVSEAQAIAALAGGDIKKALEMRKEYIKRLEETKVSESNKEKLGG